MGTAQKRIRLFFALLVIFALSACSGDELTDPTGYIPHDGPATLARRIERNNDFAFNLYAELGSSEGNLVISPHSIVTCFGMAYAGARGNTELQIADVLNFNYPQGGFHSILERLNETLVSRADVDLRIANGCWGRHGLHYETSYLDTLSSNYGASIEYLDFIGRPEDARQTINQWIKDHTAGYIDELLSPGSIDGNTYLVLANTVYFIADWLHQFDPNYTFDMPFTLLDESTVDVPMMYGEATIPYCTGEGYQAMAMPYEGEQVSMVFILPDKGTFSDFEESFSASDLYSIVANLEKTHITFRIPKFGFYSGFDLGRTLFNMGMGDAFTPGIADFSGMDGVADGVPWIDWVLHKSYIMINEHGTMAFSGTGMGFTLGIHDSFEAMSPFIFVILDIPTGTILFMGRVLDPSVT